MVNYSGDCVENVCELMAQLSSMAKRQKSSDAAPSPFPLRTITFYMKFSSRATFFQSHVFYLYGMKNNFF
jgi:hypothetical protein